MVKMERKIFYIILLIIFTFPLISMAVDESKNEDVVTYISNEEDLWSFAEKVNSGESFEGRSIELTNDINLNCNESKQWIPIGKNSDYPFKGNFDGGSFSITGLYINSNEDNYYGLFGYTEGAKITNVTISGEIYGEYKAINLGVNEDGEGIYSSSKAGAIAADCSNTEIKNCISNVQIECTKENYSDPFGWKIGGIAGNIQGGSLISNCVNNGDIYCQSSQGSIGGICG